MSSRAVVVVLVMAAAALAACAGAEPRARSAADLARAEADVARVLDDWHDAAAKSDEERYFAHFAPNGVFLGTDATERWDVASFRAYAHPHFAKKRAWAFRSVARHVVVASSGTIAWFDEALETKNLGPARGSGVLVLVRDGEPPVWRIAQYNLTITVPNERFDEVKKVLAAPPAVPDACEAPTCRPAGK